MMILNVLFFLIWCTSVNTHYTLYYSDIHQSSYPTFDCLYGHLIDEAKETGKPFIQNYQLVPYCRRPDLDNEEQDEIIYPINGNIQKTISFTELKNQNITSEQLLKWFSPIDVAEKYEMNLNDSDVFYNCSSPWFGSQCQYKFDYNLSLSFGDIINAILTNQKSILSNVTSGTCYRFLTGCNRGLWPLCLDWREICDGKIDCMNGEDEEECDQLELSKCNSDEYRCHYGGQCIPLSFLKDSRISVDCLDGSDETDYLDEYPFSLYPSCPNVATFRCQERISRYPWSFSCGDGQFRTALTIAPTGINFCSNQKEIKLSRFILTSMDHIQNISCQKAFYCALHFNRTVNLMFSEGVMDVPYIPTIEDIWNEDCESLSEHCLSEWLVIPTYPILFGLFQFVYFTNRSINEFKENIKPDFVCFNKQRCPMLLLKIISIEIINGLTCFHSSNLTNNIPMKDFNDLYLYFRIFNEQCLKTGIDKSCQNSSYFYCNESMKCISYHHVADGNNDCYFREDELFDACQLNDSKRYKCQGNSSKCVSQVAIGNRFYNCPLKEDFVFIYTQNMVTLVPFPNLCNNTNNDDLILLDIMEDETNCDLWPCNNPYTRCDQTWHCPNGADELNCSNTKCSYNEHHCQNQQSGLSYCISLAHKYDKYLDPCNGIEHDRVVYFYTQPPPIHKHRISWNISKCITSDELCRVDKTSLTDEEVCLYQATTSGSSYMVYVKFFQNNKYLCNFNHLRAGSTVVLYYFKATRLGYLPEISMNYSIPTISTPNQNKSMIPHTDAILTLYCHRGILVRSGPNQTKRCLCPPNYFGSRCQWQNQRISLTLQLIWRSTESPLVIFQLIIMIINKDEQILPYHEQITYMPNRDCNTKFNIYLLYPNRSKSLSNNYSIRIDIYEKKKLKYWASWFISIPFQFLPVNRIVTQLIIPENEENELCTLSCGEYGNCRRYINNKSLSFCQCDEGYSGSQCQIKQQCNCSNDSFCFDSSICICPLHKFGRYCHLIHSICESSNNPCQNDEICVPTDDRIGLNEFSCFCPDDYSGERCQNKNNQIDINLDKTIIFNTSLLLLHFITTFDNAEHERITLLKKVPFNDKNLTVCVTKSFNILFVQIPNQYYYLAILREIFIPSEYIYTKLSSNQRCLSIDELNKTLSQYEYLRRVKYYPLLCRKHSELKCFYDEDLMCICDIDRFSNCFLFNHTMNNDCQGYNYCENGGQCFQNNETCPTKSTCICQNCYYGSKCQLSTKGFIFSLDSILGYHIKPNLSINQQPSIIKTSIAITAVMFVLGLINGLLSSVTFRREKTRQVGTGYYLLFSSITSIFIIIMLTIKFCELISSQMSLITNRSFLYVNCISIDISLRIILSLSEWLNACVALERMMSVIKGPRFDKSKSRKMSKWIILIVFIFTMLTHIHDPIHRELIDDFDIDEHRIWCFIKYSSSVNIYNSFITLFHFLIPFSINIISAISIILRIANNRSGIQPDQTFREHLLRQIKEHRNLLIAPFVLILLNFPRLIISFVSGCMRSGRESWLYLVGYFISFIPSMLTFIIFILPSKTYKDEFDIVIEHTMRRFRINS